MSSLNVSRNIFLERSKPFLSSSYLACSIGENLSASNLRGSDRNFSQAFFLSANVSVGNFSKDPYAGSLCVAIVLAAPAVVVVVFACTGPGVAVVVEVDALTGPGVSAGFVGVTPTVGALFAVAPVFAFVVVVFACTGPGVEVTLAVVDVGDVVGDVVV